MSGKSVKYTMRWAYSVLTVLAMFLYSKTMYFGIVHRREFQYVAFAIAVMGCVLFARNYFRLKCNIRRFLPLFFVILLNTLLYGQDMSPAQQNENIGVYILFLVPMCAASFVNKEFFCKWYMRIVGVFCVVSLVCFLLMSYIPAVALALSEPDSFEVNKLYSWYHTWNQGYYVNSDFLRNCGPFWEPGAWADVLCLAILMLLRGADNGALKRRLLYLILYVLTMLTTRSTTGYIVVVLIMLLQIDDVKVMFHNVPKFFRFIVPLAMSVGVTLYVFVSGNIEDKLHGEGQVSTEIRTHDFEGGAQLIIEKAGLIGLGSTHELGRLKSQYGINENDSVGLWSLTYKYGWVALIFWWHLYWGGVRNFFNTKTLHEHLVLILVLTILHMTEGLWCLPIFVILMCYGKSHGVLIQHKRPVCR